MTGEDQQQITAQQAARLIFNTAAPDHRQVGEVCELIRSGALHGTRKGGWTTTRRAVAELLACRRMKKATGSARGRASSGKADKAAAATRYRSGSQTDRQMQSVYRDLLSEYFLSIFQHKRARRQSQRFQRVVLASRFVLLLLLLAVGVWIINGARSGTSTEQRAVLAWLDEHAEDAKVLQWLPSAERSGGKTIRVKYRYRSKRNRIVTTDRVFLIQQNQVVGVLMPDERDAAM